MGLRPSDPVDVFDLARHLDAEVRDAGELVDVTKLEELEELQSGAFSACTFAIGNRHVVVFSPLASIGRRHSDVAHELAHLLLGHEMKSMEKIGDIVFHTCDPDEEQEANWLAGCLLLPRPLLMKAARAGRSSHEIAEKYEVSEQMAVYRLRATGVLRQLEAGRRKS